MFPSCLLLYIQVIYIFQLIKVKSNLPPKGSLTNHTYFQSHDFYDVYYYEYDESILSSVDISTDENNLNSYLSNADDG